MAWSGSSSSTSEFRALTSSEQQRIVGGSRYRVALDKVLVSGDVRTSDMFEGTVDAYVKGSWTPDVSKPLVTITGLPLQWRATDSYGLINFETDEVRKHNVSIRLNWHRHHALSAGSVTPYDVIKAKQQNQIMYTFQMQCRVPEKSLTLTLTFTSRLVPVTECKLRLQKGRFEMQLMSDVDTLMWRPLHLPCLPGGTRTCAATHAILDSQKQEVFNVRVMHSQPLRMSAVQVLYKNQVAAMSHLVSPDLIPKQVDKICGADWRRLDVERGERCMLIKGADGDWGVLKATWVGFKQAIPLSNSRQRIERGSLGHLRVEYCDVIKGEVDTFDVLESLCRTHNPHLRFKDTTLRLNTDVLQISGYCQAVPETLALYFSIAILTVLCEPRKRPGATNEQAAATGTTDRWDPYVTDAIPADRYPLVQAAGYDQPVPSNSWFYWERPSIPPQAPASQQHHDVKDADVMDTFFDVIGKGCPWDTDA